MWVYIKVYFSAYGCLVIFQLHMLKGLSFLHWVAFALLSKISWLYLYRFISGLSFALHRLIYLSFCQNYTVLVSLLWAWTVRTSNQSILKETSPGYSLEGLVLKLKLQYSGHLMRRVDSLEKTLMLGGIGAGREGDDRGWDGWMASPTRWTWVWVNSGSWWWTVRPGVLWFMRSQKVGHHWVTELNWTETFIKS